MITFSFVSNAQLRELLARDYREMRQCLESEAFKSAVVLAGSIIEAMLVDHFVRFGCSAAATEQQLLKKTLSELLELALADKVISSQTSGVCHAIRGYRNLIHPAVELRMKRAADKDLATICAHVVNVVAKEISDVFATKAMHNSDTAISLFVDDPTSESRADYVIAAMDAFEKSRLFKQIPNVIFERITSDGWSAAESRLARVYERLKKECSQPELDQELEVLRLCILSGAPSFIAIRMALMSNELPQLESGARAALQQFVASAFVNRDIGLLRILSRKGNLEMLSSLFDVAALHSVVKHLCYGNSSLTTAREYKEALALFGELTSDMSTQDVEALKAYCSTLGSSAAVLRVAEQIGIPF